MATLICCHVLLRFSVFVLSGMSIVQHSWFSRNIYVITDRMSVPEGPWHRRYQKNTCRLRCSIYLSKNAVQFAGNRPWMKDLIPFWVYLLLWASHWKLSELGFSPPNEGLIAVNSKVPFHGHFEIWMRSLSIRLRQFLGVRGENRELPRLGQ